MIRSWLLSFLQRFPTIYAGLRGAHFYREVSRRSTPTPFGFNFAGPDAMRNGEFEPDETGQLRGLLESTDVFINIGANVGYYVCHARSLGKKVVAIEPLDQNVQLLQRNLLGNGWRDVEVFPLALGDRIGLEPLYGGGTAASLVSGWAGSSPRHFRIVPVTTLDNLLGDRFVGARILFLIDVEGFELPVLRGAIRQFTHRPAPAWFVEICIDEHQPGETRINPDLVATFEVFWEHGYTAARAGCESGRVTRDEVERWATGRDLPATHNFLFTLAEHTDG